MIEIERQAAPISSRTWNRALLTGVLIPVAMLLALTGLGEIGAMALVQAVALLSAFAIIPAGIFMVMIRLLEQDRRRSILLWIALGLVAASIYALPAGYLSFSVTESGAMQARIASAIRLAAMIFACGIVGSLSAWAVVRYAGRQ